MGKALGALLLSLAFTASAVADDDPVKLAAQGAALQDAGEWIEAREVYEQLEKIRGQENRAVYFQAFTAAQAGDYEEALSLAQRATLLKGDYRYQAKLLYADILARQGEYKRAKDFYIGLYASAAGDERRVIERRVAALNKILRLDAANGLTPPAKPDWTSAKKVDGAAILDEARDAYKAHDYPRALQLAQQAASTPGANKVDAKFLYANTLFKMGDFQRAKQFFIGLYRSTSAAAHRREAQRGIAAANRKLGLDERDGLPTTNTAP